MGLEKVTVPKEYWRATTIVVLIWGIKLLVIMWTIVLEKERMESWWSDQFLF